MRTILAAVLASCLFLSCNKEKDTEYFIRFKVNGEWVYFAKAGFVIEDASNPGTEYISIAGRSKDLQTVFLIGAEMPADPQPGTYDTENDGLEFGYATNAGPGGSNETIYYTMYPVAGKPNPHFIMHITSISETEIRGNFTGNYLADEDENFVEVTEGEFVVRIEE